MQIPQGSTMNIEQMANQIQAESRAKFKRRRAQPMRYRGLRSNRTHQGNMQVEQLETPSGQMRMLSPAKVQEFREGIQRIIDFGRPKLIRLKVER